jgi:rare lipoprotein A
MHLAIALLLVACSQPAPELPSEPAPEPSRTGNASWYGPGFHGQATASGEIFDASARTAAHRTLPFGTVLEVRETETEAVVRVHVTDRGPFADDRFLDLSQGAAEELGMLDVGTFEVEVRVVECPDDAWSECVP